jgi:hypothetical protein
MHYIMDLMRERLWHWVIGDVRELSVAFPFADVQILLKWLS